MSKLSNQWIDIFRAGNYADKGVFTPNDLKQIAADYSPNFHESPAVVGHPKANGPAYGWVGQLRVSGDVLQAKLADNVDPAFEEMVEKGRFKKRSASFYLPGKLVAGRYLRHVGWLGAQPPEVKGLRDVQFDDDGQEPTEVEFQEEAMAEETEQQFSERMTAWFQKMFGKPAAATSFSEADMQTAISAAVEAAIKPLRDQQTALTTSFSESEKSAATAATKSRASDAIGKLKRAGKWIPAFDRAGLAVVFDELAKSDDVVEFGEGTDKKSLTPLAAFVSFMDQLPVIVPATAVYTGQQPAAGASKVPGVNDSSRAPADPNSIALDQAIKARMSDKNIDYGAAMTQVVAEKPELATPGGAAAGAV